MKELDKFDKRFRNLSLIILICAVLILTIWVIIHLKSPQQAQPFLMAIGVALLLAGILLITRIQYVIWMKKRY